MQIDEEKTIREIAELIHALNYPSKEDIEALVKRAFDAGIDYQKELARFVSDNVPL